MKAIEYWTERFGEEPQTDADKLAVVMMREYADQEVAKLLDEVKKLKDDILLQVKYVSQVDENDNLIVTYCCLIGERLTQIINNAKP